MGSRCPCPARRSRRGTSRLWSLRHRRGRHLPALGELDRVRERFSSTCLRRASSPTMPAGASSSIRQPSSSSFSQARGATMSSAPSTQSRRLNGSCSRSSLPASIFEKSRMSSIRCSSASPLEWTTSANSRCSPVSSVSSSRPVIPMMAFIGVRISWLIVARKAHFAAWRPRPPLAHAAAR